MREQYRPENRAQSIEPLQLAINRLRGETNPNRRMELASQLALEAVQSRDDMLGIATAMEFFVRQRDESSQVGLGMIRRYFLDNPLVFKRMIPGIRGTKVELSQLRRKTGYITKNLPNLSILPGKVLDDLWRINGILEATVDDEAEANKEAAQFLPYPIILDQNLLHAWLDANIEGDLHMVLAHGLREQAKYIEERQLDYWGPSQVLKQLRAFSLECDKHRLPEKLNVYRTRFGGVSISTLDDQVMKLGNFESEARIIPKIDAFVTAIPRGDFFWRVLGKSLFLHPFIMQGTISHWQKGDDFFSGEQAWAEKIIVWQQNLAERLLLPGIQGLNTEKVSKSEKIELSPQVLSWLGTAGFGYVFAAVTLAATRGVANRMMVAGGDLSVQNIIDRVPLYTLGDQKFGLGVEDEVVLALLEANWEYLQPQIMAWFRDAGDKGEIFSSLMTQQIMPRRYTETIGNEFIAWVNEWFGPVMLTNLEGQKDDIHQVIMSILGGKYDLAPSRWGETIADITVEMSEHSMARKLGIVASQWRFDAHMARPIGFILQTEDPNLAFSGIVDLVRQDINFRKLKLSADWNYMEEVMRLIAACTLHDILGRTEVRWKRSGNSSIGSSFEIMEGHMSVKHLPRKWYMVADEELIREFLAEKEDNKEERSKSSEVKKPAYVPAHVRRTPYGAVMEALIASYRREQDPNILAAIRHLRDGIDAQGRRLVQANPQVLEKLPKVFREKTRPITDPDGHTLWTRMFVSPYFSPRLAPEAYENMDSLFRASYESHGSTLAFLEVALAELAGLERDK
jgi:hypothetical protein